MRARRRNTRFSGRKKPWESLNWIPYMGNFNINWQSEDGGTGMIPYIESAGQAVRVIAFTPASMDKSTLQPVFAGTGATIQSTDGSLLIKRMQGKLHFDAQFYHLEGGVPTISGTSADWQAGQYMRIWYAWVKERITQNVTPENISDLGYGPGLLSDIRQLQSKRLMSWGTVDWAGPDRVQSTGLFSDSKPRTYHIPLPRIGKLGLRLGTDDSLTCVVRISYGLQYGRDLAADVTNDVTLPYKFVFQPQLRFLVAG